MVKPQHPSGKPKRALDTKRMSVYRVPLEGPVAPRLQRPALKDAIGFKYNPREEDDYDA